MAILVPLVGFLIVDHYSKNIVSIPRYYVAEGVDTVFKDGKTTYDTVYHQVKNFQLTNQLGQQVSLDDLDGKIVVVNLFFAHCPVVCPKLTKNIKSLQDAFVKNDTLVQFLSLSVDPVRDSVSQLKRYADHFDIDPGNWWLLTGSKQEIYDLARHELFVSATEGDGGPNDFIHSEKLIVLDKNRYIRGYYNGLDSTDLGRCAADVAFLFLEKDHTKPGLLKRIFSGGDH